MTVTCFKITLIFVPVNGGEAAICLADLRHVFRFIVRLTDALEKKMLVLKEKKHFAQSD